MPEPQYSLVFGEEDPLLPGPHKIIRTETVISKLPMHNLAKRGNVNIQITKKNESGEIELQWEVSYSYGQARQFAYKLDTIVINRRIDETVRPLPVLIKLGSLREIARELGLSPWKTDTNKIRKALHQNAGIYIIAKLHYIARDGSQQKLEAGFTRYSVIFTGERFSDGRTADAVYIELHPRYREVLENAPVRPLDYDYLKALPPAPQRFYEIISYRMFAALKYKHPFARLSYSDYCTFSAQQRYFDYDHFKKQMYKVHVRHIRSGYLVKVHYEEIADSEGNIDWMMFYTPGPKAKAEYLAFSRKPQTAEIKTETLPVESSVAASRQEEPQESEPSQVEGQIPALLKELTRRKIAEGQARKILKHLSPGQEVMDQIEYFDALQAQGKLTHPAGWLADFIKKNNVIPPSFVPSRIRKLQESAKQASSDAYYETLRLELAYRDYKKQEVRVYIKRYFSQEEYQQRLEAKIKELLQDSSHKFLLTLKKPESRQAYVEPFVEADVAKQMGLLSFKEFCERERSKMAVSEPAKSGKT